MDRLILPAYRSLSRRVALAVFMAFSGSITVLFPAVHVFRTGRDASTYIVLILLAIVLVLIPVGIIAEIVRFRVNPKPVRAPLAATIPVALFFAGVVFATTLFLVVTVHYEMLFRRVGFEVLVENTLAMPTYAVAVHRTYMEVAVTLICSTIALVISVKLPQWLRFAGAVAFGYAFASYFVFVALNNRFQSGILIASLFIVLVHFVGIFRRKMLAAMTAGLFVLSAFSFQITDNVRNQYDISRCIDLHALNPLENLDTIFERAKAAEGKCTGIEIDIDANNSVMAILRNGGAVRFNVNEALGRPLVERLNGIAFIADIAGPALEKGFGWGAFWEYPLLVNYYTVFAPERATEIKRGLRTNAKVHIASRYLGKTIKDVPSTFLTDLYANFAIFGFLIAGGVFGVMLGWIDATLANGYRAGAVVLALFMLEKCLYAEKEFITFVIDLVKFSPIPLASALLLWRVTLTRYQPSQSVHHR